MEGRQLGLIRSEHHFQRSRVVAGIDGKFHMAEAPDSQGRDKAREAGETRRYLLPRVLNCRLVSRVFSFSDDPLGFFGDEMGIEGGWEHQFLISLQ